MALVLTAVFVGGGLGALSRYAVSLWVRRVAPESVFPWATWGVNIVGCFVLGFLAVWFLSRVDSPAVRAGVMTGFLGGLTTFSTFGVEAVTLMDSGQLRLGLAFVAGNVIVGLVAAWAGLSVARGLG